MKKKIKACLLICIVGFLLSSMAILHFQPQIGYVLSEYVGMDCETIKLKSVQLEKWNKIELDRLEKDVRVSFDQSLFLVNGENPLEEDISPEIEVYNGTGIQMNRCLLAAFEQLSDASMEVSVHQLVINSAYRTREEQRKLYEEDPTTANEVGCSEHEMGLALDLCVPFYGGYGFLKTEAGQFVNSHCWEYGFIIRYPVYGKKETNMKYEPWHIRYVGKPHAKIIYNNQLTLEEYLDMLEEGQWYQVEDYLISKQKLTSEEQLILPFEYSEAVISPDNMGDYIVTVKI